MKEYAAIIAASIAAVASIVTLLLNTKLTINREKRKALWDKEIDKFMELEEVAGQITEDLLSYRCRDEKEKQSYFEKAAYLRIAAGRFRRYPEVLQALRELNHSVGWYFSQDTKHESKEEYEQARSELENAFAALVTACDKAIGRPT
jgi:beta-phosphoglucomutase-like phosphatase (HAD superfamily)